MEISSNSAEFFDLKKYWNTFYIENDNERAYINALVPLRKAKEAYTKFANSVQSNDLDAIKTSEEEFIKYEDKLNETIRYFSPSINQTVKDYVVVPKEYYESEYIFKNDVPVEYAIYESKTFDVKALFDENVIVANIICQENDFDMLVIPSSSSISSRSFLFDINMGKIIFFVKGIKNVVNSS